jgi:hypothetical protein
VEQGQGGALDREQRRRVDEQPRGDHEHAVGARRRLLGRMEARPPDADRGMAAGPPVPGGEDGDPLERRARVRVDDLGAPRTGSGGRQRR